MRCFVVPACHLRMRPMDAGEGATAAIPAQDHRRFQPHRRPASARWRAPFACKRQFLKEFFNVDWIQYTIGKSLSFKEAESRGAQAQPDMAADGAAEHWLRR